MSSLQLARIWPGCYAGRVTATLPQFARVGGARKEDMHTLRLDSYRDQIGNGSFRKESEYMSLIVGIDAAVFAVRLDNIGVHTGRARSVWNTKHAARTTVHVVLSYTDGHAWGLRPQHNDEGDKQSNRHNCPEARDR